MHTTNKLDTPTATTPPTREQTREESGHTPGPWHIGHARAHGECFITSATGKLTIANSVWGADNAEAEANARLIAAAPELLEALKGCLASWANENALTYETVEEANAAIEAAERQP